mmetsp:Transcript_109590/g.189582  ORF Transcript_109590/g.189582 Transcript_109590/m.189582 type:complete len:627 (+) Transcript_109590:57-1937(+)
MSELRGTSVSFDDLLGYSKLQSVLSLFVTQINDLDGAIQLVRQQGEASVSQLEKQLEERGLREDSMLKKINDLDGELRLHGKASVSHLEKQLEELRLQENSILKKIDDLDSEVQLVRQHGPPAWEASLSQLEKKFEERSLRENNILKNVLAFQSEMRSRLEGIEQSSSDASGGKVAPLTPAAAAVEQCHRELGQEAFASRIHSMQQQLEELQAALPQRQVDESLEARVARLEVQFTVGPLQQLSDLTKQVKTLSGLTDHLGGNIRVVSDVARRAEQQVQAHEKQLSSLLNKNGSAKKQLSAVKFGIQARKEVSEASDNAGNLQSSSVPPAELVRQMRSIVQTSSKKDSSVESPTAKPVSSPRVSPPIAKSAAPASDSDGYAESFESDSATESKPAVQSTHAASASLVEPPTASAQDDNGSDAGSYSCSFDNEDQMPSRVPLPTVHGEVDPAPPPETPIRLFPEKGLDKVEDAEKSEQEAREQEQRQDNEAEAPSSPLHGGIAPREITVTAPEATAVQHTARGASAGAALPSLSFQPPGRRSAESVAKPEIAGANGSNTFMTNALETPRSGGGSETGKAATQSLKPPPTPLTVKSAGSSSDEESFISDVISNSASAGANASCDVSSP